MEVAKIAGIFILGIAAGFSFKEEYFFPTEEKISKAYIEYKKNEASIKNREGLINKDSPK